ncbi:probable disease resistance protein At1g61190 [Cryptomeria japonica]|uniref:probable disease resistance protein At1g61190 n=1 Tax=Cryptomeria japonica TaxID=3369 RepID=UPI0027DA1B31|nr:probable disease resistance protein At1g61190 [Cryptomeria japonica]
MGGVGKTFLMQNVFDRAKGRFNKSIWLSISQTYSLRKLQADMASQIKLQAGEDSQIKSRADDVIYGHVTEVQGAQLIHECLTNRSSLIVLDDVWWATREDNLISALGLPTGNNTHQQNQPPHQLEGIARQVERECVRLPLAVKIVAASLAGEASSREWESKLGQLKAVSYTEDPIMQILKLSYDSLPPYLKPCFAYLSFFPEDAEIEYRYLINLWVAEGYVPQGDDQLGIGWRVVFNTIA